MPLAWRLVAVSWNFLWTSKSRLTKRVFRSKKTDVKKNMVLIVFWHCQSRPSPTFAGRSQAVTAKSHASGVEDWPCRIQTSVGGRGLHEVEQGLEQACFVLLGMEACLLRCFEENARPRGSSRESQWTMGGAGLPMNHAPPTGGWRNSREMRWACDWRTSKVQSVHVAQTGQELLVVNGSSCVPGGVRENGCLEAEASGHAVRFWVVAPRSEGCHTVFPSRGRRLGRRQGSAGRVADAQASLL